MEVKINREIRNYTESMFFGLSLRQFVFSLLAVGVAVLLYFVLKPYVGTETVSWMCILGAAPFAAMGFVNYNGMFLDAGKITIGSRTLIGPNCSLYTPQHPIDYMQRRKTNETALPIVIGEDCWLGGNVTVCPGVTIGNRTVIGAGSVVTHDIPSDCMAAGNPCKVIKHLD